ncbi:unnamed protein product [Diabrotica balteata]|uniref:protein-tyrosine-phosphatase n=1 Tax=Diabrotica balteata TaxID=107213 RepID=A0A9N9XER0_DIABA|nr:unnamed protein product [Diabrotica balteata]
MRTVKCALQILSSEEKDHGKYECVAENSIGTDYSKHSLLYVKVRRVPPQFSIPPPTMSEVKLGDDLNLTCVAVGSPMPFVKWRKGLTQELTPEDKLPVGKNTLELTNIQESANYTCIAASALGVIEALAQVKVQSLPGPPTNVKVSEITATSVRLTWSYNGPEDLQYYVIQFKPKYANQAYSEISGIITMYYSVRNLSPYTEYEMFVIAVNSIGRGPTSAPAVVTTGETEFKIRYERLKKKGPNTPTKNVREMLIGQKVTPEVKRKLVIGEVLQQQLKGNYKRTFKDKQRFVHSISGDIVKKYRCENLVRSVSSRRIVKNKNSGQVLKRRRLMFLRLKEVISSFFEKDEAKHPEVKVSYSRV